MIKFSLSLLFSNLDSPSSFSFSTYDRWPSPFIIFVALCCAHFSYVHVFPILESPGVHAASGYASPGLSREEISLPTTCWQYSIAVQDAIGVLCHKGTLLTHGQLDVHQNPHVLLVKRCSPANWSQHIRLTGITR